MLEEYSNAWSQNIELDTGADEHCSDNMFYWKILSQWEVKIAFITLWIFKFKAKFPWKACPNSKQLDFIPDCKYPAEI